MSPKAAKLISEIEIDGIHLRFTGSDTLPLVVVLYESPVYDGPLEKTEPGHN